MVAAGLEATVKGVSPLYRLRANFQFVRLDLLDFDVEGLWVSSGARLSCELAQNVQHIDKYIRLDPSVQVLHSKVQGQPSSPGQSPFDPRRGSTLATWQASTLVS